MSIVYLTHLSFSLPNPSLTARMAAAAVCFNWAAWRGRTWCIDNGAPIENYVEQVHTLALTTTGKIKVTKKATYVKKKKRSTYWRPMVTFVEKKKVDKPLK